VEKSRSVLLGTSPTAKVIVYIIMIILGIIFVVPFYWMLVQSTHTSKEILGAPPPLWFGVKFSVNYHSMMSIIPFWRNFLNSLFVAGTATVATLFFCSAAGFAFAMYDFPAKKYLFGLLLLTMMIPGIVLVVPWFILMTRFGWLNTFYALIVPGMVNAFGIFWMRQYISSNCPKELLEASRIDGCPEVTIFFRIFVPIIVPAYGALGILAFLAQWNNFFFPLIILQSKEMFTIPVALKALNSDPYKGMDFGVMMTGSTMAVTPVLIVFWIAAKQFISGMTAGAVKG